MDNDASVLQCDHCGTTGDMTVKSQHSWDVFDGWPEDAIQGTPMSYWFKKTWQILLCDTCKKPTFREIETTYIDDNTLDEEDQYVSTEQILYPSRSRMRDALPEIVKEEYIKAIRYQSRELNECAMYVGRTLEAVCAYENATGRTLYDKLEKLAAVGRLPQQLLEIAHHSREIRNFGVHRDEKVVLSRSEIRALLELVDMILEYLYLVPHNIDAARKRLTKLLESKQKSKPEEK